MKTLTILILIVLNIVLGNYFIQVMQEAVQTLSVVELLTSFTVGAIAVDTYLRFGTQS